MMRVERVQVNCDQDHILLVLRGFGEKEYLVVVGSKKLQIQKLLQRRVIAADRVDQGNELLDVSGLIPVTHLDLIFFRIEIFFGAGYRLVFAQFKAAVDSVGWRQRRGDDQPHLEGRASAGLQNWRKNV